MKVVHEPIDNIKMRIGVSETNIYQQKLFSFKAQKRSLNVVFFFFLTKSINDLEYLKASEEFKHSPIHRINFLAWRMCSTGASCSHTGMESQALCRNSKLHDLSLFDCQILMNSNQSN